MNVCGIIAEYNPFHKGHIYHLEQAREQSNCDCLVVIVSSFYSQRGLPSIVTREDKTRLALEHGANLVLELPACYAMQSADYFAKYAIQSLSCLHINTLCFGSELNDMDTLSSININKEINPKVSLNHNLQLNLGPNDILAYQYIKCCKEYGIHPISIQRNVNFKSATQTRIDAYSEKQDFQEYFHLEQNWNSYYSYLRLYLQLTDSLTLSNFFLVNEGIEHRLKEAAKVSENWNDFLNHCVTKGYSKARIQRTCLMVLLQIQKKDMENASFYECKVLGFDSIGQSLLKENKNEAIYTKFSDLPPFLKEVELKSNSLYNTVLQENTEKAKVIYYER